MAQANEKAIWTETFTADEDLSDYQYYGVALSDDRKVDLVDADTDKTVGVLQNDPEDEQEALVCVMGRSPVSLGETVAAGALLRCGSDGQFYNWDPGTDTTAYCCGMCTIGGAEDEVGEALIWAASARGNC
jgi:WD40 repeat protein